MTFGENLKYIRKEKGLSQKDLGQLIGVSGTAIGKLEASSRTPRKEMVKKLADALGVNAAELDPDLSINLGSDSYYQTVEGDTLRVPAGSLQDQVLSLLRVLTDPAAKQWIAIGQTLSMYSDNRKDHGRGLKPKSFDTPEDFEKEWSDLGGGKHPES